MTRLLGYKNKRDAELFLLCFIAYSSTYICRLNFSSVIPQLTRLNVMSADKIASVSSAFFICYGLGQLFSGIIGDKINTRYMIFVGVLFSSISNILIFFFNSYFIILALWALNGIFQSFVWSPILKLASVEYDSSDCDRFGIQMSVTVPLGTLLSYGVSLVTMLAFPWKYVFLSCGIVLFAASLLWIFGTSKMNLKKTTDTDLSEKKDLDIKKSLKLLASTGTLLLLVPIVVQGTLKDSVTQWVPEFFSSSFNSNTSFSLMLTMLLPVVNVTGAFFAKRLNDKLKSEAKTSAVFFFAAFVFLLFLELYARNNIVLSLICMVVITNCMFGVNVMLITIVPLKFARHGNVGTVAGLLNAAAYVGCGITNQIAGEILNASGWKMLIAFWIALSVIAVLFCLLYKGSTERPNN